MDIGSVKEETIVGGFGAIAQVRAESGWKSILIKRRASERQADQAKMEIAKPLLSERGSKKPILNEKGPEQLILKIRTDFEREVARHREEDPIRHR